MSSVDFAQLGIEWAAYDSLFDRITGLPNGWALLIDRLEVALARSRRTRTLVAVFVLDRPRLFGDELFGKVVTNLRAQLRPDDTLARIGPHRLAILCTDINNDDEAAQLVRRILHDSGVICTLGIALSRRPDTSGALLTRAIVAATEADAEA
jgi:GGDEF domain-containing protein